MSDENEKEEQGDHNVIQKEIGVSHSGQSANLNKSGSSEGSLPDMDVQQAKHTTDDLHYGTDDSSGDEQAPGLDEVDFKVSALVSAFANNHVIQNLCWLLKFYKSNSTRTNHYIICILRKICDDLELSPRLYQVSTKKIACLRLVSNNEDNTI